MSAVDRAPTRRTRMQNGNRFKLGLFGMNCSGSVPTVVPERWKADWPETCEAARLADAAGLEFLLPIARWLGYGGVTDRHGTSFETLSWASALLAVTQEIVTFATVHAPLLSPVFAAKSCVTADHVGRGRFGLNVVSGWNVEEFAMFGARLLDHDYRYQYTEEWVSIVKKLWSEDSAFNFSGKYFELKNVGGKPKPWGDSRPLLMSAGSSPEGRAFAARHADCLFMVIGDESGLADEIAALRASANGIGVFASGHLMCRATPKETKDYYHYVVHENGDWEAAETVIRKRIAGDGRSLPQERLRAMMERFISGGGTFPVIGSYDEVAATFKRLADAGLDGMAIATVNYVQDMPVIRDEVLPRLERLGLRQRLQQYDVDLAILEAGSGMVEHIEGPLYYETMGKSGPVMAFVHPNPMDQSCWIFQMAQMSTQYRCIALDLPGYGRSPKARQGLTMQDVARACWAAVDDAYPGEKAVLVGCSIGSSMLTWMHNDRPQQTAAMIMCGTGYNPKKDFIPPRIRAYQEQGISYRWGYTFEDFSPAFRSTPMAHFFADLFADRNVYGDVGTIITQFEAYRQPEPEDHHAKVACPAIIITGSEDNTHRTAFALQKRIAGCELRTIYGAGHACQIEQPALFNRHMIEFLTAHGLFPRATVQG